MTMDRTQLESVIEAAWEDRADVSTATKGDTRKAVEQALAMLDAGEARGIEVPLMISFTVTDMSGRNLSGHTIESFWASVRHARPLTIGLNCSFGAPQLRPSVTALAPLADTLLMVYPNAGLPNDLGEYDEEPETTGGFIGGWADVRFGPKLVIVLSLIVLVLAGTAVLFVDGKGMFWIFGLVLSTFVGPVQSASRSFMARIMPEGREGEMFGLYATTGRAVSFLAPTLFGIFVSVTGDTRFGILGIVVVLLAGLLLVLPVHPKPTVIEDDRAVRAP